MENKNKHLGINNPFSLNNKLLYPASKYWIIEVWPNLKWRFATPNTILFSFIKLVNGRWYKPASGLFTVSKLINNIINKVKNIEIEAYLNMYFLSKTNKYRNGNKKMNVLNVLFKLVNKLNIKKAFDKTNRPAT